MPRYTFTLHDHIDEAIDAELPDDDAARVEAIRFAGELLRDQPELLSAAEQFEIVVSDAAAHELFRIDMHAIRPDG